jgi:uncharacterized protein (TIGR02118 family)
MIKVVALIRRHPDMEPEAFRAYWHDVHAPLVRERLPALIRYIGSFPVADAHGAVEVDAMQFDAIVELGFADRAAMEADMSSEAFMAQDRQDSSARFMDARNSRAMVVEEINVL